MINRFFQGCSSTMIVTTIYSICTIQFKEKKEAMLGYCEAACGIGLMIGPGMGSALYALGGYQTIFYSIGLFFILIATFIVGFLSKHMDGGDSESYQKIGDNGEVDQASTQITDTEDASKEKIKIRLIDMLCIPRFFFAVGSGSLCFFIWAFMEPILAIRVEEFGLTQEEIALFFMILPLFAIFACLGV